MARPGIQDHRQKDEGLARTDVLGRTIGKYNAVPQSSLTVRRTEGESVAVQLVTKAGKVNQGTGS